MKPIVAVVTANVRMLTEYVPLMIYAFLIQNGAMEYKLAQMTKLDVHVSFD